MSLRVSICSASGFLATVTRKALSSVKHIDASGDHRDKAATLAALRDNAAIVIVDAELLVDATSGPALKSALASRRAPTIVLDARGRGIADLPANGAVSVVLGRRAGELDLSVIDANLPAALAEARRRHRGLADALPAEPEPATTRPEPHLGPLELVVLGVSTGGPTLLMGMLGRLDRPTVRTLIVQHMPESETPGFAARLSEESGHAVVEVGRGALPDAGTIGVLRGGHDYRVARGERGALHVRGATLPGNPFHPNIDEVLLSAVTAGVAVGAAILTGMGQDGAAGALAMSQRGLPVIAQRPHTCAVAGMPQSAIDNGAARLVQTPDGIVATLNRWWAQAAKRPLSPQPKSPS